MSLIRLIVPYFALLVSCFAVAPYELNMELRLDESWRWTELEDLVGLDLRSAHESKDGIIWFSGNSELLSYDGRDLQHYPLPEEELILSIQISKAGDVLVLTGQRFLRFEKGNWVLLLEGSGDIGDGRGFFESADGAIWLARKNGFYRFFEDERTFFNAELGQVSSMVVDARAMIWTSTNGDETVRVFDSNKTEGEGLELAYEFAVPNENDGMRFFLDSEDRVWFLMRDSAGRCYFYENYEKKLGVTKLGFPFQNTYDMELVEMASGQFWFMVARGLSMIGPDGKAMHYKEEDYPIPTASSFIAALSSNRLIIGGPESKTFIVDLSNDHWARYLGLNFQCEAEDGTYWFISHDHRIVSGGDNEAEWVSYGVEDGAIDSPNRVYCSSDGVLWASGMHEGVAAISYLKDGRWGRRSFADIGAIFSHLSVVEASDGSVLFGAGTPENKMKNRSGGAVVGRLDGESVVAAHVPPPVFPKRPSVIVEKEKSGFWFGGDNLSRRYGSFVPELIDLFKEEQWIDHIVVDSENGLWLAVWGKGIYKYENEGWIAFKEGEGLSTNQVTNLLAEREGGRLWAATSNGLSRFDGRVWSDWGIDFGKRLKREGVCLYGSSDESLWINRAYRLWLLDGIKDGEREGLFYSIRYRKSDQGPDTEILASNNEVPEGSSLLMEWTGKDFWSNTPRGELEFSWRLGKGEWSPFMRKTSTALLDVASGDYVFEVRARDRDFNIDETPARMDIYVIPVLWKRPWFILLVFATFAVIVFLVDRLLKVRVRSALAMEEFKLDFFTNISHELRTPLSVIVGPLEALLRDEESSRSRSRLKVALRNARKMQGLVNQLLQFRKLELGKSTLRPSAGELIGFLKEAIELHSPLWEKKEQTMTVDTNEVYFVCSYDAEKLQKIVDNLVSNAIKYTAEGLSISIRIEVSVNDGHRELDFVIEDQGEGIPPYEIDHVLKPFYRLRDRGQPNEGFGLGLALVGELVQIMGGEVTIESPIHDSGKGTRVRVHLPLMDSKRLEKEAASDDMEEEVSVASRAKVLLVEDNPDLRLFMKEELSDRYEIFEAENGEEALESAIKLDPDLIITDVMMPKMDGFELCRRLRSEPETSHIPIIILRAKSSEEHSMEGVEVGADAFFAKPLNMLRLIAQIENLLAVRRKLKMRFSEQLVIEPTELSVVSADQEIIRKAISIVESNMKDIDFGVDQFAREMGMGRTTLLKKLKALTGQAPNSFIRSMRLKRAAQLLESGNLSVSDTLGFVGIQDPSYFSRTFKKEFGISPSQYSAKHAKKEEP